MQHHIILATVL